jgi:hypothetical protein
MQEIKEKMTMVRSTGIIIAVVLQVLIGLINFVSALRILAAGINGASALVGNPETDGPPFWAGVMFLVLAVATLFSAYGLWQGQRWGKIVTIVTGVILIIFALGDLVGAVMLPSYLWASVSVVYVAMLLTVQYLVLRRQPQLLPA